MFRFAFLIGLAGLGGCITIGHQACAPGRQPMLVAELLFGRNVGDRLGVSEAAFGRFVDEEVTPRFPDGLTILAARGQYRDTARDVLVREQAKLIIIALKDEPDGHARISAVAEAYKRRFNQQSVGTILKPACVSF